MQSEVEELAQAYQDAYEAALESFQGQFGLFDEASTSSEEYLNSTVANAQAALESQLSYWTTYQQNISALKDTSAADLGITQQNYDALMSYVQSGSEEAAGLAASMVQAINSGNTEAVAELANTLGEVNSAQSEIASTTAEWQTGFTEQMNQYAQDMNRIVTEDLELSEEARTAATSTINSYVNAILAGKPTLLPPPNRWQQPFQAPWHRHPQVLRASVYLCPAEEAGAPPMRPPSRPTPTAPPMPKEYSWLVRKARSW